MALVAQAFQAKPPRQPANADMSDPILDPLLALIKERIDDLARMRPDLMCCLFNRLTRFVYREVPQLPVCSVPD